MEQRRGGPLLSGSLWLLAQIYPDLLPRLADHSYFNPIAWQFIFCIVMFVGTWYNSRQNLTGNFPQTRLGAIGLPVVGAGLLYKLSRALAQNHLLNLGTSPCLTQRFRR